MRRQNLSSFLLTCLLFLVAVPSGALAQECACDNGEPSSILSGLPSSSSSITPRFLVSGKATEGSTITMVQLFGVDEVNIPLLIEVVEEDTGYQRDILRVSPVSPLADGSNFELRAFDDVIPYYTASSASADPEPPTITLKNALNACCEGVGAELIITPADVDTSIVAYRVEVRQRDTSTIVYALAGDTILLGTGIRGEGGDETAPACATTARLPAGSNIGLEVYVTAVSIEGDESAPIYASSQARPTAGVSCAAEGCSHTAPVTSSWPSLAALFLLLGAGVFRKRRTVFMS